ncbi:hypothetical protein UP17_25400 (plasmid) [Peribacillus simplex]|uniref:hypothetical protein n=1 Tax=Peribacillus simplex TaxID=1478 RepID=UPI000777AB73|nr:hypothetical protein [Peribacillus simplex]AMM95773.1 hypothetical protein UP17_25400 [Peribacillus simplex]
MEWNVDQDADYLDEDYILNILNDYLINAFDLYEGEVIEGLSYTMYNVEVLYGMRKDYTVVLFTVLELLEKIKERTSLKNDDIRDLNYWEQKLKIHTKENGIDMDKLRVIVRRTIAKNLNRIHYYISNKNNNNTTP